MKTVHSMSIRNTVRHMSLAKLLPRAMLYRGCLARAFVVLNHHRFVLAQNAFCTTCPGSYFPSTTRWSAWESCSSRGRQNCSA